MRFIRFLYKSLVAVTIGYIVLLAFNGVIRYSILELPYENRVVFNHFIPQGFEFFTKSVHERTSNVYVVRNGELIHMTKIVFKPFSFSRQYRLAVKELLTVSNSKQIKSFKVKMAEGELLNMSDIIHIKPALFYNSLKTIEDSIFVIDSHVPQNHNYYLKLNKSLNMM